MAFTCKAPADIRPKKVIELLLGALPLHTRQPLSSLLMAVLPVCQLPQLQPASVLATTPSALSNACPVCSARDFAWFAKTSSTISEMVCSRCNDFSFQGWPKEPYLHTFMLHIYVRSIVK
jgi:hypothetical protein